MVVAQGSRLNGRVYHATPDDSVVLSDRSVVLHEVGELGGSAIDSVYTDHNGRYRFVVFSPGMSSEFFVSVEHHDVGYFSSALHLVPEGAVTVPPIVVYDTSYARPNIVLHERHIIVRCEDIDGTRQVIELIALRNSGWFTRIAADTSSPVWQGALPSNALQFAIGESQVGVGAVYRRGDSLAIAAPIPPGEKQVLFSYIVPRIGDLLEFPVDQPTTSLTVSLEDTTATAVGRGLALYGVEEVGGVVFRRYEAAGVPAGMPVTVRFEKPFLPVARLQFVVVFGAVLALVGTLTWWMRRNHTGERRRTAISC